MRSNNVEERETKDRDKLIFDNEYLIVNIREKEVE
jgi:hypothetical protein